MSRTNRLLAGVALATAVGLALTACAGDKPANTANALAELPAGESVEIVFESYNLSSAGIWADTIQTLIDQVNTDHPNIKVVGQPGDSAAGIAQSVQKQLLAGQA
ncbi:MAG: hypothetical protein LBK28_01000, partial [Propionibacteriaceae bacterium]|nr:hypothetical protein [Propionibacteriaceae bacterium]